jgi:thiol-disulfide isomerase/thioredoxin
MVLEITSLEELKTILKNNESKLVVLDVFAQWCPPCKAIEPHILNLSKTHKNVVFLKVDSDEVGEVAKEYDVSALPTFIFLLDQQEVFRVQGANRVLIDQAIGIIQPLDPKLKEKLIQLNKDHQSGESKGFNWIQVVFVLFVLFLLFGGSILKKLY